MFRWEFYIKHKKVKYILVTIQSDTFESLASYANTNLYVYLNVCLHVKESKFLEFKSSRMLYILFRIFYLSMSAKKKVMTGKQFVVAAAKVAKV